MREVSQIRKNTGTNFFNAMKLASQNRKLNVGGNNSQEQKEFTSNNLNEFNTGQN